MDYGITKTLPVVGTSAIVAGTTSHHFWPVIIVAAVIVLAALAVRFFWRKGKKLDD